MSSSLKDRQQDELNSVASIYGDIFRDITPLELVWNKKPSPHFQISLLSSEVEDRPLVSVIVDIEFTPTYPLTPPKIKLVEPKNLLKARIHALRRRVEQIVKEYPQEEISFTVICEIKDMLDEFQKTTEKVLSLEEERELRLKNERIELEKLEARKEQEQEMQKKRQIEELSEQILKIQGEYDEEIPKSDSASMREIDEDQILSFPDNSSYFTFANPIIDTLAGAKISIKFRSVIKSIKFGKKDLLSRVGTQYIVRPSLPKDIEARFGQQGIDKCYLLTEIDLVNSYWTSDEGKKEIQELERELQLVMNINHDNIGKLFAFQIDRVSEVGLDWKIRLLTEFSPTAEFLQDILTNAQFINWSLARTWLIQLLPGIEHIHNLGLIHKLICPITILIFEHEIDYYYQSSNQAIKNEDSLVLQFDSIKTLKICHVSYGYRILRMVESHPNELPDHQYPLDNTDVLINALIPKKWMAPELSLQSDGHQMKTDIWDLGVLFVRLMLGFQITYTDYPSPDQFFEKFDSEDFVGLENYASLVYDLLSKMLQTKISKRPSPLELNAVKFLRDGPLMTNPVTSGLYHANRAFQHENQNALEVNAIENSTCRLDTNKDHEQNAVNERNKRNLTTPLTQTTNRRYSNTNHPYYVSENYGNNVGSARNIGRYERDFEEVGRLGKGGFGEVVKARNRIEGTFYAIKKIKHRSDKLDTLLSEVLSLARLNHQYIVRYYGTWVEEVPDDTNAVASDEDTETESDTDFNGPFTTKSSSYLMSHDNSFQVDFISNAFDPKIEFDDDLCLDDSGFSDGFEFARSADSPLATESNELIDDPTSGSEMEELRKKTRHEGTNEASQGKNKSILYIQMEFCENNTLSNLIEQGLPSNPSSSWKLFRQLLEAVSYIHREGFIHRDLKPMNIFIDRSNNIKVGDFGLAKSSQLSSVVLTNNQIESTNNKDLSTIVGTVFYTANEVATGDYDEKVDMYSLGIIFFEMCYPLATGMERAQTLNNLRLASVEFPANFTDNKYKTQKRIIKLLLDHDPKKRPGAAEILLSGWLPVEHQDQVIKEALKSLADPSSSWQQQVREALFNQPYLLANDIMFDNNNKGTHVSHLDHSISDYLLFSKLLEVLFKIFRNHGAIEDFSFNNLLPKSPSQAREMIYEVLDRSGSVLTLPFDLVLPTARFLSRTNVTIPKIYRHEFVYRPNIRGVGMPNKYSAVNFDVVTHDIKDRPANDAECLKVVDEILEQFPCFKSKGSQSIIMLNHSDIIDSVIAFSFGNIGIDEKKRHDVLGILSQLGIERNAEEIKMYLRKDFNVPHTVTNDLIDVFNFTVDVRKAKSKLQKAMLDSPYFAKVEKALDYTLEVLSIFEQLGVTSPIYLNPLGNYNSKYYTSGIMFQAIHRVDKNRKFSRVITGGRYDALISSFMNKDVQKFSTPYGVGFSLTSTFMFLLMKNLVRKLTSSNFSAEINRMKWKRRRCDVLVTSMNSEFLKQSGFNIVKTLWANDISADLATSTSPDDVLHRANVDGADWVVLIKQPLTTNTGKHKKVSGNFKPLKVRSLIFNRDTDLDYGDLVKHLLNELEDRKTEDDTDLMTLSGNTENLDGLNPDERSMHGNNTPLISSEPLFSTEIDQKVTVVPNDAPRGRKNNKREKWELENDSKIAGAQLVKQISSAPVITIDARDEVLDLIVTTSLNQPDEWVRKVVYTSNNFPKSFANNIYNTLRKEVTKGTKWAVLYSPKTEKTSIIDLQR